MDLSALLSRYQNLELLLDSLTEAIISHDLERRITTFNRAAERLTGLGRNEVLGKDCHEVIQGGLCGSHCSFCEHCVLDFELLQYPLTLTDRDGREHQVEMTVVPMKDADEKLVGILASARDVTELTELRRALKRERSYRGIVGKHLKMQEIYELIREIAPTEITALIQGESGTGKELVARAVHAESARSSGPFVAVNCGALPESLLESELFGHVRGAFTGAVKDKRGRFELAQGGTLFLDEVGELGPPLQVKLLRVLQEKRFERVGGEQTLVADVRILAATNRNLREMVRKGQFREDLFYRLAVIPLTLPPLRERPTDIPLLIEHFLQSLCEELHKSRPTVSRDAHDALLAHPWPGNVRELVNALQHALILCRGGPIELSHLPPEIGGTRALPPDCAPVTGTRPGRKRKLHPDEVQKALAQAGGNHAEAARQLGVGRSTLYRALREHT